ncbi:MAG: hypothetical protein ACC658_11810 [Acidimicrobiia bacterium]
MKNPGTHLCGQWRNGVTAHVGKETGRLVGTIRGSIIEGYWVEAGSSEKCSTSKDGSYHWGRIVATLEASGRRFNGKWGYCDENPTREWTGTCSGSVGAGNR